MTYDYMANLAGRVTGTFWDGQVRFTTTRREYHEGYPKYRGPP